jgi:hypothetical protein
MKGEIHMSQNSIAQGDEIRFETHADIFLGLGFIPAYLDFGTQTLHAARWSPLLIPGFERNGFFYTRTAAAKAVSDWRFAAG